MDITHKTKSKDILEIVEDLLSFTSREIDSPVRSGQLSTVDVADQNGRSVSSRQN
jgi:hypothetical protein